MCAICHHRLFETVFEYTEPDKYEKWCGIKHPVRRWKKCYGCGFHQKFANYLAKDLDPIYEDGYRSDGFRGESIDKAFERINSIPPEDSENNYRWGWFVNHIENEGIVLDIGSGLGVWPYSLKESGWEVQCVEPNKDSATWISGHLGIPCSRGFYDDNCAGKYSIVSLVHVLEHIDTPDLFLQRIKRNLLDDGELFIEVPDAVEFEHLDKDHDEFNSTHIHFFDVQSLNALVKRNGFNVKDIHRVHYDKRNLDRLMMVCNAVN